MKTYLLAPLLLAAAFQSRADVIVNITSLPTVQLNGQYEGFAGGIVNNKDAVSLLCDDINHETFVPSGNLQYRVSTIHDLSGVRFSGPNALHNYREAALLIMGDGTSALPGIMNVSDPTLVASYQYALWDLFAPSAPGFGSSAALGAQASLSAMSVSPASLATYDRLRIYTPTGAITSEQETLAVVSGVPEPGALVLLGTALLGAVFLKRRKSAQQSV